jgi:hypothetical protein
MPKNSSNFFNREAYDAYRILKTEAFQPIIHDMNLRLLGTHSTPRKVSIKSISVLIYLIQLVRRAGSEQFLKDYREPYFFLMDREPYLFDKKDGVAWL